MKKTLLSLALVLGTTAAFAAPFDVNDAADIQGTFSEEVPKGEGSATGQAARYQPLQSLKLGDYTFTFANGEGKTEPAYYYAMSTNANQDKTIRLYSTNTMTVTAPAGTTMGQISITGTNGKTGIVTADAGTATSEATSIKWSTTEPVSSVTFTFSGSFRIRTVEISSEAGSEVPDTPVTPTGGLFNIDFKTSQGGFTFEQGTLPEGLSFVWKQDAKYGLVASGYYQKVYATDAWAISPVVELKDVEEPTLTFAQAMNNFKDGNDKIAVSEVLKLISVNVREEGGEWTALTVPNVPTAQGWDFVESGNIDLSAYLGKKIQIGFHYTSTDKVAGTWEISYAKLAAKGGDTPVDPNPPTPTEYDILVNDATEIDGEFVAEKPAEGSGYPTAAHYQPLNSCQIGDYYFSFSNTTSENANQQPALYLPMSTSTTGNKNLRMYNGCVMTIQAPEGTNMYKIDADGSNADSGLTVTPSVGNVTLDGAKMHWEAAEGANSVSFTFDKKIRFYGFNIETTSGSVEEVAENVVVYVIGNDIIAPEGADIYSLTGVKVNGQGVAPGVYVVRAGNKAVKVLVK